MFHLKSSGLLKQIRNSVILNIFVSSIEPSLLLGSDINVSKHSNDTRNINVQVHAVERQFKRIPPNLKKELLTVIISVDFSDMPTLNSHINPVLGLCRIALATKL